jgi:hypothetical protein
VRDTDEYNIFMSITNDNTHPNTTKQGYCPPHSNAAHCAELYARLADDAGLIGWASGNTAKIYYNPASSFRYAVGQPGSPGMIACVTFNPCTLPSGND